MSRAISPHSSPAARQPAIKAYLSACQRLQQTPCREFITALEGGQRECDLAARGAESSSQLSSPNGGGGGGGLLPTAPLTDGDLACIAEALKYPHTLRCLSLEENAFGLEGVGKIIDALGVNNATPVREVRLGRNNLRDPCIIAIANALTHAHQNQADQQRFSRTNSNVSTGSNNTATSSSVVGLGLKILDFSENGITNMGCSALCQAISMRTSSLVEVSFHNNHIDSDAAAAIADAITSSPKLKHLHLGYNQLKDSGATQLARCIPMAPILSTLDLTANRIGPSGGQELAKMLMSGNCRLQRINLRSNGFDNKTLRMFADVIMRNTTLAQLSLGFVGSSADDDNNSIVDGPSEPVLPTTTAMLLTALVEVNRKSHNSNTNSSSSSSSGAAKRSASSLVLLDLLGWPMDLAVCAPIIEKLMLNGVTMNTAAYYPSNVRAITSDACQPIFHAIDKYNWERQERSLHDIYIGPDDRHSAIAGSAAPPPPSTAANNDAAPTPSSKSTSRQSSPNSRGLHDDVTKRWPRALAPPATKNTTDNNVGINMSGNGSPHGSSSPYYSVDSGNNHQSNKYSPQSATSSPREIIPSANEGVAVGNGPRRPPPISTNNNSASSPTQPIVGPSSSSSPSAAVSAYPHGVPYRPSTLRASSQQRGGTSPGGNGSNSNGGGSGGPRGSPSPSRGGYGINNSGALVPSSSSMDDGLIGGNGNNRNAVVTSDDDGSGRDPLDPLTCADLNSHLMLTLSQLQMKMDMRESLHGRQVKTLEERIDALERAMASLSDDSRQQRQRDAEQQRQQQQQREDQYQRQIAQMTVVMEQMTRQQSRFEEALEALTANVAKNTADIRTTAADVANVKSNNEKNNSNASNTDRNLMLQQQQNHQQQRALQQELQQQQQQFMDNLNKEKDGLKERTRVAEANAAKALDAQQQSAYDTQRRLSDLEQQTTDGKNVSNKLSREVGDLQNDLNTLRKKVDHAAFSADAANAAVASGNGVGNQQIQQFGDAIDALNRKVGQQQQQVDNLNKEKDGLKERTRLAEANAAKALDAQQQSAYDTQRRLSDLEQQTTDGKNVSNKLSREVGDLQNDLNTLRKKVDNIAADAAVASGNSVGNQQIQQFGDAIDALDRKVGQQQQQVDRAVKIATDAAVLSAGATDTANAALAAATAAPRNNISNEQQNENNHRNLQQQNASRSTSATNPRALFNVNPNGSDGAPAAAAAGGGGGDRNGDNRSNSRHRGDGLNDGIQSKSNQSPVEVNNANGNHNSRGENNYNGQQNQQQQQQPNNNGMNVEFTSGENNFDQTNRPRNNGHSDGSDDEQNGPSLTTPLAGRSAGGRSVGTNINNKGSLGSDSNNNNFASPNPNRPSGGASIASSIQQHPYDTNIPSNTNNSRSTSNSSKFLSNGDPRATATSTGSTAVINGHVTPGQATPYRGPGMNRPATDFRDPHQDADAFYGNPTRRSVSPSSSRITNEHPLAVPRMCTRDEKVDRCYQPNEPIPIDEGSMPSPSLQTSFTPPPQAQGLGASQPNSRAADLPRRKMPRPTGVVDSNLL